MKKDIKQTIRSHNRKNLIKEAFVLALLEQEQMAQLAPPPPAINAPPTQQEMQPPAPAPQEATPPQANIQGQQPISLDSIIERLNVIRGGKSFTNPEVYGQMVTYFKSLNDQNKDEINKFVQEIAKIVTNNPAEASPQQPPAPTPAAPPAPPVQNNSMQPPISPAPSAGQTPQM